jgi:hypothetical protein
MIFKIRRESAMSSEVGLATDWELFCLCWEAVFLRLAGTNYVKYRLTGSGAVL